MCWKKRFGMTAVPERGYKLAGWQEVNVSITTQTNFDANGNPILPPVQSIVLSFGPTNDYSHDLEFKMQDIEWITLGSNPEIAQAFGWQVNFVPWYEPVMKPQGRF